MALRTNIEAAQEIPNQLMLRDIGGQIVVDFIEMKDGKHIHEVEKVLRQALKVDRARARTSAASPSSACLKSCASVLAPRPFPGAWRPVRIVPEPVRAAIWNGGPCRP